MKGWRRAIKYVAFAGLQSDARRPPEQKGPAERQQGAESAMSSSYVQTSTSRPSKSPLHPVPFCCPAEKMLCGAATGRKKAPSLHYHMHHHSGVNVPFYHATHHSADYDLSLTIKKQKLLLPRKKDLNHADIQVTGTERVCWQGGSDSPRSISARLIYGSSVNQTLQTEPQVPAFQPSRLCGPTVPHRSKVYH